MSYRVTIELDAPQLTYGVGQVAAAVGLAFEAEAGKDLVINRIDVEREDA